jgi:hypothetical protein
VVSAPRSDHRLERRFRTFPERSIEPSRNYYGSIGNEKSAAHHQMNKHTFLSGTFLVLSSIVLALLPITSAQAQPAHLLAAYSFDAGAVDATGNSGPMVLGNAPVTNSSLYLNGKYSGNDPQGFLAIAPITGLSYDSFTVALDFNPADFLFGHASIIVGGTSYRWFSLRHNTGKLEVTLNNQSQTYVIPNSALQPGRWQSVLCSVNVAARKIVTFVNNIRVADIDLPVGFRFEVVGSPAENFEREFSFANYSNADVFSGYVDNLKVWSRALSASEIDAMIDNPSLTIQRAVIVSWPNYPSDYVLQCSTVLAGPYEAYTGSIFSEASQLKAAVPLDSPQKFFRLHKP